MIFVRLWNYLIGYLVIRVEGLSLEKFINLAVANGIYLWKINRHTYTRLTACVSINGFRKLHSICRKVHCRIRIQEKRGLPFLAYRYKRRKMLFAGMVLFLIVLYGFSSFIWSVEVVGTEKLDPQMIMAELAVLGIKPGAFKGNIDKLKVENKLIVNIRELSWASLEIRGSKALVKVAEAVLPPEMFDKSIPANLVAARDGIIQNMIILDGEAVVKVGDTVKKGQLLVSGIIDHPDTTGTRYVHSMGQVMARTWYEESGRVSLKEPIRERTGEMIEFKHIEIGDVKLRYKKPEIPYEKYELEIKKEPLLREGQFLSTYIVTERYHEIIETEPVSNIDKACKKAEELAMMTIRGKMIPGAKVIDKKLKCDIIEGEEVIAVLTVEALENIAVQKRITVQTD